MGTPKLGTDLGSIYKPKIAWAVTFVAEMRFYRTLLKMTETIENPNRQRGAKILGLKLNKEFHGSRRLLRCYRNGWRIIHHSKYRIHPP
jgi:hypothetical protein